MTNGKTHRPDLVLPFVLEATQGFVQAQKLRESVSLSLASGKPLILFGPGGNGKSEFVRRVLSCVEGASVMVQSFGEGMDEARLYGGVNLAAINDPENPRIEFDTENSWLDADAVVMEEIFDAPSVVLLSLKDTMTSRQLNNGRQTAPMETEIIFALTNHTPRDIADQGPEVQALIERFPVQALIDPERQDAAAYAELFSVVGSAAEACPEFTFAELLELRQRVAQVEVSDEVEGALAELLAEANTSSRISFRSAIHARDLVKASAAINGREYAIVEDIVAVKYLPGMESIAEEIENKIQKAADRAKAEGLLEDAWRVLYGLKNAASNSGSPMAKLKVAAALGQLEDEITTMIRPPQELAEKKSSLLKQVTELATSYGSGTEMFLDVRVVLPEALLGCGYNPQIPESGSKTVRELRAS